LTVQEAWTRWLQRALVLVVCAVVPSLALAQTGKLTGVVTDAESGQPIEGVQIVLQGTGIGSLTADNGRFFILNVPVGTYTVVARRIGYQTQQRRNVQVLIDVTGTVNFALATATPVLPEVSVTVAEAPLIQPGVSASQTAITAQEMEALPVVNIAGVLQLQQGYFQVPDNTDIISFTDTRRNPNSPVRIRGGRPGETLTLLDGIPVNNFVFGGEAFDLTREAVQQVNYERGGFEPQYGNALSGIVNTATREGGTTLQGAIGYQTSAAGGALGNTSDDLRNFDLLEGYLSGPVPSTGERLRFMVSGRSQSGRDRVLEFDDDVYNFTTPPGGANTAHQLDLFPGWRAFGYNSLRDVFGKLTFLVTPTAKLNFSYANYQRQRLPFDFDYLLTGFDPLTSPAIRTLVDTLAVGSGSVGNPQGLSRYQDIVQGSIRVDRELWVLRWDHTVGRWAYRAAVGRFDQERQSCNFYSGICLAGKFADINFTGRFVAPGISTSQPAAGTDEFFGGERLKTTVLRGDVQGQVTDHHNVQFGVFYQRHDLVYSELRNLGVNDVAVVPQVYRGEPWDAALYFQDKIEFDFLTVKLGARYDFGRAGGLFFANPQNPTNGTTAREVCDAAQIAVDRGLSNGTPYSYTSTSGPDSGTTYTGFTACTKSNTLLSQAARSAQGDDFTENSRRRTFSPRIAMNFPLSATSSLYFNFGRFAQNPLYNNLYQNTNIGVDTTEGICGANDVKIDPGTGQPTDECAPIVYNTAYTVSFLGNPNLLIERATQYEIGYAAELGRNMALTVAVFSKDQEGLSGVQPGGVDSAGNAVFDVGSTYGGSLLSYSVILNQDYQTVRGFEIGLRRRVSNFWGFNLNYSFSQATTNAPPPEVAFQSQEEEGDPASRQEIRSEIDQPHVFNATLTFLAGEETPNIPLGSLLRNASASLTLRASSGLPYTPTTDFTGFGDSQLERNSGRGPSRFQVDLFAAKDWRVGSLRYGAFLRVANLLDTRNCIQVYTTTGRCDAGTIDQSRSRQGNTVGEGTVSTFFNRPQYFGERRSVNAGLRVSF
jgi:outer membrane receptor protein involved in Fe transport